MIITALLQVPCEN